MESYVCLNCRYRFKTDRRPSRCPYCDKAAVDKEKSASEIVDEVEIARD
jgi:DNA-directed RNA polymerase subunit RPC12/RpoP